MLLRFKAWLIARRFKRATAAYDRAIAEVRARHGRVREAQRAKTEALHNAMRQAVQR